MKKLLKIFSFLTINAPLSLSVVSCEKTENLEETNIEKKDPKNTDESKKIEEKDKFKIFPLTETKKILIDHLSRQAYFQDTSKSEEKINLGIQITDVYEIKKEQKNKEKELKSYKTEKSLRLFENIQTNEFYFFDSNKINEKHMGITRLTWTNLYELNDNSYISIRADEVKYWKNESNTPWIEINKINENQFKLNDNEDSIFEIKEKGKKQYLIYTDENKSKQKLYPNFVILYSDKNTVKIEKIQEEENWIWVLNLEKNA